MGICLEEAYETLHRAIIQLGPKRPASCDTGETAIASARGCLENLQTALLIGIDRLSPNPEERPDVSMVTIMLSRETLRGMERYRLEHLPDTDVNMMPELIIRDWLSLERHLER